MDFYRFLAVLQQFVTPESKIQSTNMGHKPLYSIVNSFNNSKYKGMLDY